MVILKKGDGTKTKVTKAAYMATFKRMGYTMLGVENGDGTFIAGKYDTKGLFVPAVSEADDIDPILTSEIPNGEITPVPEQNANLDENSRADDDTDAEADGTDADTQTPDTDAEAAPEKPLSNMNRDELIAKAEAVGVVVPEEATKAQIKELIVAKIGD